MKGSREQGRKTGKDDVEERQLGPLRGLGSGFC